jgi:hypothetical protein
MTANGLPVSSSKVTAIGGLYRALDPADRASELLFGLIMVLTFTLSLGASEAGKADINVVLIGALGCNLAWGVIDAVMYLMGVRGERGLAGSAARAIRNADSPEAAYATIAGQLPPAILPALSTKDFERIRLHLRTLPEESLEPPIGPQDYLAAIGVFFLVFFCVLPVAAPFLLIDDLQTALRISNAVAILMLFLTGFAFGRHIGRPWQVGLSMVAIGLVLVAIAIALGG